MEIFDRIAEKSQSRGNARCVLMELARRIEHGQDQVSGAELTATLNIGADTTWTALKWLKEHGEIESTRCVQAASRYRITL